MELFKNGAKFIRMDSHLHTIKDKEFKYTQNQNQFIKDYLQKLKEKDINVGIITNHNKFDFEEFKNMKKKAIKEEIYLIPGVELSVKEGKNGLHILIGFSDSWIEKGNDKINTFLDAVFRNVTDNRENENTRCGYDLFNVLEELERYNKDYFIIFAHVDQKSGLFNECDGGMITTLFKNELLRSKTLGLQKSHNNDNYNNFISWTNLQLSRIEGSDPKSIEEVGKGNKKTYIKIGDFSFDSVKYSLMDNNRLSDLNKENLKKHGYIKSLFIEGGKFDKQEIFFSSELNNIIGIRGSGKSAILEILRDILGLKPDVDKDYKDELVTFYMGSGGKATLNIIDRYNRNYKIIKYFSENKVYIENENGDIEDISINSLINIPLYFGQKDLSMRVEGYEIKLLEKLVGNQNIFYVNEFKKINNEIEKDFNKLIDLLEIPDKIKEQNIQKNTVENQLKVFKEKGIDEKLEKIQAYNIDSSYIGQAINKTEELIKKFNTISDVSINNFENIEKYQSKYNEETLKKLYEIVKRIDKQIIDFDTIKSNLNNEIIKLKKVNEEFEKTKDGFLDEFEELKREFKGELNADTYLKLNENKLKLEESITDLENKMKNMNEINKKIKQDIKSRRDLIIKSNKIYEEKVEQINKNQDNIKISFIQNGNNEQFILDIKLLVKGSGIRNESIIKLSEQFIDYVGILEDIYLNNSNKLNTILKTTEIVKIESILKQKIKEACEYKPNNSVEIKYHDKLLKNHSLGQRASAIILFILAQKENDLIIIDQPEDDLDNKVIYDELIKTIKNRKKDIQFVFSTHNPNIPVLGDAEQVISIRDDNGIIIDNASIDNNNIQNEIVEIMEGGEEAFNKRKKIYQQWKV